MELKNKTYNELCDIQKEIHKEMTIRETEQPVGYSCCECNFSIMIDNIKYTDADAFWKVYDHLQNIHGYPDEDAGTGTERINR